jgi:L-alanine-DL-glutamate epimerase-like enolase superfamily enzyme
VKIARVEVYGYELTYIHGTYVMSGGRESAGLPSTVVRLITDEGAEGWGEVCPLGTTYLPAFADGARAAIAKMAPALLGLDPRHLAPVHERLDAALAGHAYAKSPIDIACWDLLAGAAGCPLTTLLGGRRQADYPLYFAVPLGAPSDMAAYAAARRAEGIHRFQLKVGGRPQDDAARVQRVLEATGDDDIVIADANGGWTLQDAIVAVRLLEPLQRVYVEQPCATLEECLAVRRHTTLPMVLDEIITDVPSLLRAAAAHGLEAFNLKISKVGGLTNARLLRDLAEALGLRVTIEDTWGGDLVTAAVSHLAASTSARALFTVSFMNDWVREHICGHEPRSHHGIGRAPEGPGLGVRVNRSFLGAPLFSVSA